MFATSVATYLANYGITPEDTERIKGYGRQITPVMDSYVEGFYEWLREQPEFEEFFGGDEVMVRRVAHGQGVYWREFFSGTVDEAYLAKRRMVGQIHARIGLPLPVYFAAMNMWVSMLLETRVPVGFSTEGLLAAGRSITKLIHLDTAVVVEVYAEEVNAKMSQQTKAIMEMSTPVSAIWEDVLLLPLVGLVDSRRAHDVMNAILLKISQTRSKVFILDISGVGVVDTAVANHLIKITQATRLMGCESIISGLSPAVAQTMVELGVQIGEVRTTATLRDALDTAFQRTGFTLTRTGYGQG
jgi:rsbT co-antagonist protein RsbR